MRFSYPAALFTTVLALGCNAQSLTFTKRQDTCSAQCAVFETNINNMIKCGDIADTVLPQETIECVCKPEVFKTFEDCSQCTIDAGSTSQDDCDIETLGAQLNILALKCSGAGINIDLIALTYPAGFLPSSCPKESGDGLLSGAPAATGMASSAGGSQPTGAPLSAPAGISIVSGASSSPSGSKSGSAPIPTQSQGSNNSGVQSALNYFIFVAALMGVFINL